MFNLKIDLDHDCFSTISRNRTIKTVLDAIGQDLLSNPTEGPQKGIVKHHDNTVIAHWKIE